MKWACTRCDFVGENADCATVKVEPIRHEIFPKIDVTNGHTRLACPRHACASRLKPYVAASAGGDAA